MYRTRAQAHLPMGGVLFVGLAVRAGLIPGSHGQDFIVWRKASTALLHGVNFYAHHPHYPNGPYAYFPLWAYLEAPFRWASWHTPWSFTVLGKLPILAVDIAVAVLIDKELQRHGARHWLAALGAALYFLNPLVLYNSAYYGRFDSLALALLLFTYRQLELDEDPGRLAPLWYGLSIAAKTFPAFVWPGILKRGKDDRWRFVIGPLFALLVISLPYLVTPHPFFHDLIVYDTGKFPSGMSWQHFLFKPLAAPDQKLASRGMLVVFVASAILLRNLSLWWYTSLTLVLFMLCIDVVWEQYLIWPMPWLILIGLTEKDWAGQSCLAALAAFTAIGMLDNENYHPFGNRVAFWPMVVALATLCVAYLGVGIVGRLRPGNALSAPLAADLPDRSD